MHRSRATLATLLTVVALLAVAVAPVAAAKPNAEAKAKAEHQRIVAYWTAERIAGAKPRDFVRTPGGKFQPKAQPGSGSGGTVKGASWTGGGPVVERTGKVLFTMAGGNYVCSASVVQEPQPRSTHSLVLTAGQ